MIFSVGLIAAVLFAAPLRADYLITRIDGTTLRTHSYWIQDKTLYLADSPHVAAVYEIRSVTGENLTPDEIKAYDAAMDTLHTLVFALLGTETHLAAAQGETLSGISQFPVGKKNALPRKERKALKAALTDQKGRVEALIEDWRNMKLPDFSLIKMRDIKEIQLLSLDNSLRQALKYVDNDDPSYFEYAKANLGQYASFDEAFRDSLPWE